MPTYTATADNSSAINFDSSATLWGRWTASDSASATWDTWVIDGTNTYVTGCPTPETEEAQERRRQLQREQQEAVEVAERLLRDNLSPEQVTELERDNAFSVPGGDGASYRIRRGRVGNIDVMRAGRLQHSLCVHPIEGVPDPDTMLSQKLMLESCEQELLEMANIHR